MAWAGAILFARTRKFCVPPRSHGEPGVFSG
jgi:hypothetical protein